MKRSDGFEFRNHTCSKYKIFHKFQNSGNSDLVISACLGIVQGSHSSWKNDNSFSSPGKVLEFYNFIKNHGKMNYLGKNSFKLIVATFISAV